MEAAGPKYAEPCRGIRDLFPKPEVKMIDHTEAGATDNGAPGLRQPRYYAAFVLDPDGNNIEAVFRGD